LAAGVVAAAGLGQPAMCLSYGLKVAAFQCDFALVADALSLSGRVLVLGISSCVFMFRAEYIAGDHAAGRFTALLSLFVLSILTVLFAARLPAFLVGWDGLGVTSALLILHYDAKTTNRSCIVTFATNRLGDAAIIAGAVFFLSPGTFGLSECGAWAAGVCTLAGLTKTAQYPFAAWLPLAMDAPTPVSALVHSRTLVTAGLFAICRILPEGGSAYLAAVGAFTLVLGASCALAAADVKKLIAFSTLSNLGLMVLAAGVGDFGALTFHLFSHAIFKAGLFLVAGCVLVNSYGVQDGRAVGGASPLVSTALVGFAISSLGLLYTSAYFSKHGVLARCQTAALGAGTLFFLTLGVVLRGMYRLRLAAVFLTGRKANTTTQGPRATAPVLVLAVMALVFGNLGSEGLPAFAFVPAVPTALVVLGAFGLRWFSSKRLFSTVYYLDTRMRVVLPIAAVKHIDAGPAMLPFRGRYALPPVSVNPPALLLCCLMGYLLR